MLFHPSLTGCEFYPGFDLLRTAPTRHWNVRPAICGSLKNQMAVYIIGMRASFDEIIGKDPHQEISRGDPMIHIPL